MRQRTPEWIQARVGKATASRIADIVARTKSGYAASRANYAGELVCERLTGHAADAYSSPAMQWGAAKEAEARLLYEFLCDAEVVAVGFLDHPTISLAGASPDGVIGDTGLVEIKCPLTATHVDTLIGRAVPGRYLTQMQWQMAVTGRQWCDFVSYDPRLPLDLQLFVERVQRDDARIAELEDEVQSFLTEVDALVVELNRLGAAMGLFTGQRDGGAAADGPDAPFERAA